MIEFEKVSFAGKCSLTYVYQLLCFAIFCNLMEDTGHFDGHTFAG